MMEDDGEIEYLDEDEEIVQQYVQNVPTTTYQTLIDNEQSDDLEQQITPLLVERKSRTTYAESKRKSRPDNRKNKPDEDSDYDPTEDLEKDNYDSDNELIENYIPQRKRKKVVHRTTTPRSDNPNLKLQSDKPTISQTVQNLNIKIQSLRNQQIVGRTYENKLKSLPNITVQKKVVPQKDYSVLRTSNKFIKRIETAQERRQLDIRIPDYEDPLCLPVRAFTRDANETKKLKQWNNLCLEQFKQVESVLKPDKGSAVCSTRTIVLRNAKKKNSDKIDTVIFGKTTVENQYKDKKTISYQATLPKYREKKILHNYPLMVGQRRPLKHTFEAVLTMEEHKDEKTLVVYSPKECISAVYKFMDTKSEEDSDEDSRRHVKRYLKEATCCKVCAPCYQTSWRGVKKHSKPLQLRCPMCAVSVVTVYSLLTHVNATHSARDVAAHANTLSRMCAEVLDYHYRCKICQEKFNSIKLLRKHVTKHQGFEIFKCEVGNHMAS